MSDNIRAALIIQNSPDPEDIIYVQIVNITPTSNPRQYLFDLETPLNMIPNKPE